VPQNQPAGPLQLVGTFNSGPLAAVIQSKRELTVQK
jgi:hypothetical protein